MSFELVPDPALAVQWGDQAWTYAELAAAVAQRLAEWSPGGAAPEGGPAIRRGVLERTRLSSGADQHRLSSGADQHRLSSGAGQNQLIDLYAAVVARRPLVLLHPRWTPAECEAYLAGLGELPAWLQRDDDEAVLAVLPTSGSTGKAKGVALSRRAFLAAAAASAANLGWQPDDRWLLSLPLAHVGGLSILLRCWLAGRTVVVPTTALTPDSLHDLLVAERITLLSLVPTQLRRLLQAKCPAPPTLRAVLLGGAAAPLALLQAARAAGWPVLATYGLTEACSQVATQPYPPQDPVVGDVGPPIPGLEVRCSQGVVELRGPTLMSGYLPASQPGQGLEADRFFRTGDLGVFAADGHLRILGRVDDVIITGGENVSPQEVEAEVADLPGIDAAVAFGWPDAEWGEIVAVAVVASPAPDLAKLREQLRPRLAPFKLPRRLLVWPELPTTPSGKIDRKACRALAASAG